MGLDSGMLISLVDNAQLFSDYLLKIDEEEGLLFTHEICTEEAVEVLSRDYGWKREEAQGAVQKFLEEHNIDTIPRDRANSETVQWMFEECKKAGINFIRRIASSLLIFTRMASTKFILTTITS